MLSGSSRCTSENCQCMEKVLHGTSLEPPWLVPSVPDSVCADERGTPPVPNIIHRVMIGQLCRAPVLELVSLLTQVLLLEPERVIVWTDRLISTQPCIMRLRTGAQQAVDIYGRCLRSLETNLTWEIFDMKSQSDPLVRATRKMRGVASHYGGLKNQKGPAVISDYVRLYALNSIGGYYFDGDVFVVSPDLARWRRCRGAVLGKNDLELVDTRLHDPQAAESPPPTYSSSPNRSHILLNSAAMLMGPNTSIGKRWWADMHSWEPRAKVEKACCHWPTQVYRKQSSGGAFNANDTNLIHATASIRLFHFCFLDPYNRTSTSALRSNSRCAGSSSGDAELWRRTFHQAASRPQTDALHFANWKNRRHQWKPVLTAALERAIHLARPTVRGRFADCLALATELVEYFV